MSGEVGMQLVARLSIVILIGLMLVGCQKYSEPETALRSYAFAVQERRCSDSLELLSARTRYALDALREKPQHADRPRPLEEYYCNKLTFDECKVDELAVPRAEGDSATVTMSCGRTQDSFLPGFPSMFLKYEPREFELVREDGRWLVVLPFVIKVVEVREREDELIEKVLLEQQAIQKRKAKKDPR